MKNNYTQDQIKCKIADTKRMYLYYVKMAKNNDSKFVKSWIEDLKNEYNQLTSMIDDRKWVIDYCIKL